MIRIYGLRESLNPIKAELSRTVHSCLVDVLGLPEDKRAQRFFPLDKEDFYMPGGRSDRYTVIELSLIQGRSEETKKELIHVLFRRLKDQLGIAPIDVEITITEQPAHCWGFRGVTADEAQLDYRIDV